MWNPFSDPDATPRILVVLSDDRSDGYAEIDQRGFAQSARRALANLPGEGETDEQASSAGVASHAAA